MAQIDFKIEINQNEVILNPQNHQHTIIWIHGLNESPQKYVGFMLTQPLIKTLENFRIVLPRAPKRFVTAQNTEMASWFDIKFRSQKSFIVDFDEAFSSKQVLESYQTVLKPLIQRENKLIGNSKKLFLGGFSQGCGMSLHCFYNTNIQFGGVVGVSGYLFPFTQFSKQKLPKKIIYGTADVLRPWDYVKITYQGKITQDDITMVDNIGHEMKPAMIQNISKALNSMLNSQ